jgi:hypothetical protein
MKFAMALICLALLMFLNAHPIAREGRQAKKSSVSMQKPGTVV